jgi:hypothetical protein
VETILIVLVVLVLLGFIPIGGRRRFSNNSLVNLKKRNQVLLIVF